MNSHILQSLLALSILYSLFSCSADPKVLPILGHVQIESEDTLYHEIPDFSFVNQDSQIVTNQTYSNKIYVADFFFTSCPSICPKVKKQMLRIHKKYKENQRFMLVSHTIDPKRDSVSVLNKYASNLGVSSNKWHFLTGPKGQVMDIADEYFVVAYEDPDVPGGFDHSGKILLVDTNRHIRAFCDGTDPESVTRFLDDIDALLYEYR